MSNCKMFKHGITIGTTGMVRPCCMIDYGNEKRIRIDSDDWIKKHEELDKKSTNSSDGWIPECYQCRLMESDEYSQFSLRNKANRVITDSDKGIVYWDLKINNTCNLACRMCDAGSSSTWQKLVNEHHDVKNSRFNEIKSKSWHRDINNIMPKLLDAKIVKFTGGEPFLIPQVKKVIDYLIEHEVSQNTELSFISNGTQDIEKWLDILLKFKKVNVQFSIDAIGSRFNYIRSGADWKQVSENILNTRKKIQNKDNFKISVVILPQALNVNHMDEVEEWCNNNNIEFSYNPPVVYPDFMSPEALTNPELRAILIEHLKILDRIHGTDYRDFINE